MIDNSIARYLSLLRSTATCTIRRHCSRTCLLPGICAGALHHSPRRRVLAAATQRDSVRWRLLRVAQQKNKGRITSTSALSKWHSMKKRSKIAYVALGGGQHRANRRETSIAAAKHQRKIAATRAHQHLALARTQASKLSNVLTARCCGALLPRASRRASRQRSHAGGLNCQHIVYYHKLAFSALAASAALRRLRIAHRIAPRARVALQRGTAPRF